MWTTIRPEQQARIFRQKKAPKYGALKVSVNCTEKQIWWLHRLLNNTINLLISIYINKPLQIDDNTCDNIYTLVIHKQILTIYYQRNLIVIIQTPCSFSSQLAHL